MRYLLRFAALLPVVVLAALLTFPVAHADSYGYRATVIEPQSRVAAVQKKAAAQFAKDQAAAGLTCTKQPAPSAQPDSLLPDYQLTETDNGPAQSGVQAGPLALTWQVTITNIGHADATKTVPFDFLEYSDYSPTARNLSQRFRVLPLKQGQSVHFSGSFALVEGDTALSFFVGGCVQPESSYLNNSALRSFTILTHGVDLNVLGMSYNDLNHQSFHLISGDSFTLSFAIENLGDSAATKPITVSVRRLDGGTTLLTLAAANLPPPNTSFKYDLVDSQMQPVVFSAPTVNHFRTYKVGVSINTTRSQPEKLYTNNANTSTFTVDPQGINLWAEAYIYYPNCFYLVGETDATLLIYIYNSGSNAAAATTGALYLDGKLFQTFTIPAMTASSYIKLPPIALPAPTKAGTHIFKVVVDPKHSIKEWNTADNIYQGKFAVYKTPSV